MLYAAAIERPCRRHPWPRPPSAVAVSPSPAAASAPTGQTDGAPTFEVASGGPQAGGRGPGDASGATGGGRSGAGAAADDDDDGGDATRRAIRARIETHRRYPELARRRGIEGTVRLRFSIRADGTAGGIEVVEHADPLRDRAAEAALREAAPLPRLPGSIEIALRFRLTPDDEP